MTIHEKPEDSLRFRQSYLDGIRKTIEARRAECDRLRAAYLSPESCAAHREDYRKDFLDLLGSPLREYEELKSSPMAVKSEPRGFYGEAEMTSLQFEVLPGLWFYGIYFEHPKKDPSLPFVISQHGGAGTPEVGSNFFGPNNYTDMTERALNYGGGANVFAPGLILWTKEFGPEYDRASLDIQLKQVGSSITALELFALRRTLDYFVERGIAHPGSIGMLGLSYGGFYTLMTAAAEPRIDAAYASCQYNDRYRYGWEDWTWTGAAEKFLDAEIAALVAPRALYLEEGDHDPLFDAASFEEECRRALPFFEAAGAADRLGWQVFDGDHELAHNDNGFDFLFRHLTGESEAE